MPVISRDKDCMGSCWRVNSGGREEEGGGEEVESHDCMWD